MAEPQPKDQRWQKLLTTLATVGKVLKSVARISGAVAKILKHLKDIIL